MVSYGKSWVENFCWVRKVWWDSSQVVNNLILVCRLSTYSSVTWLLDGLCIYSICVYSGGYYSIWVFKNCDIVNFKNSSRVVHFHENCLIHLTVLGGKYLYQHAFLLCFAEFSHTLFSTNFDNFTHLKLSQYYEWTAENVRYIIVQ